MEKEILEEKLKEILKEFFDELSKLEKPKTSKIGGTYYGRTELVSSVGNHLDYKEDVSHISYDYCGSTSYRNACIVRVGGAYRRDYGVSTTSVVNKLKEVLGGNYVSELRLGIIDDYGTNFSTVGFGYLG